MRKKAQGENKEAAANTEMPVSNSVEIPESGSSEINIQPPTEDQKAYKRNWAILISKVWEIDPLFCPKCGGQMKIISVINDYSVIT